jgi:hypothetical protein
VTRGVSARERGDRARHERRRCGEEAREAQPAGVTLPERRQFLLDRAGLAEQRLRVPQHDLTRGRDADGPARPVEQRHAELALEGGDRLGDARLRVGEREGGGRERAAGGHGVEDAQAAQIQHRCLR